MFKWLFGLAWIGVLMMSGCAMAPSLHFHKRVAVIAHRGASDVAPENTLAAFALAARMHADWAELDCQLSREGEVIVAHDPTLNRTTNGRGRVADATLADLKKLDAGSWKGFNYAGERIPTLGEALDLARREKIGLYIEIKDISDRAKSGTGSEAQLERGLLALAGSHSMARNPELTRKMIQSIEHAGSPNLDLTRKVLARIRSSGLEQNVVIQSFSPVVCAVARAEAPELRVELLGEPRASQPAAWADFLAFASLTGAQGGNLSAKAATPERIRILHGEGRTVAVWTVDDPAEMRRLAQMGVDAIITNRPDVCLDALQEMRLR